MAFRDPERPMCLRCSDSALSAVESSGVTRQRCSRCDGTWIADDQLGQLLVQLGLEPDEPLGPLGGPSTLRCPVCRTTMVEEVAYGEPPSATVDVCPDHGAWFDGAELQAVIEGLHLELASRKGEKVATSTGVFVEASYLADSVLSLIGAIRKAVRGDRRRPRRSRGRAG